MALHADSYTNTHIAEATYLLRAGAFVDIKKFHKGLHKGNLISSILRASNIDDNRHGDTTGDKNENTHQNTHFDLSSHYCYMEPVMRTLS